MMNHEARFPSFGQKRQYLLETAPAGLVSFWDDDDIYLPNHLSYSLEWHRQFKTPASKHMAQWFDGGHRLYRIGGAAFMNTVLADRQVLLDVGGFDPIHNLTCVSMMHRLVRAGHLHGPAHYDDKPPTFIYRIKDGKHHVSSTAPTEAYSSMDVNADLSETGVVEITPQWNQDYIAKASASWGAIP
jgi:hypothetical protein